MKKTISVLMTMFLISSLFAQKQPVILTGQQTQDNIRLKIDHGVVTVKNLNSFTVTITLHGTTETELTLTSGKEQVVHMTDDAKYIEASVNGSKCGCWVHLVTYCGTLPIIISDLNFKMIDANRVQITFTAYNTPPYDTQLSFFTQYSYDGINWVTIKLDIPEVTGISQKFVRIVNIKP
jgi:hypothetical protein